MIRVGIDGGCWGNRRGYGRFLREAMGAMLQRDAGIEFTVFLDAETWESFPWRDRVRAIRVPTSASVDHAATSEGRRSIADLLRMSAEVAREKFDVFFFSTVYSYFPLLRPVPMLLGIHDTMADRHPEFAFASRREHRFWNWKVRLALAQARLVLTVSKHSRRSIEEHFGIASSRIRVVTEAAAANFSPVETEVEHEPYVFYVGGLSPNKNLLRLVRAFARLPERTPRVRLILAGDFQTDGFKSNYEELKSEVQALNLQHAVVFPGFVTEERLRALYSGASVFAFPSLDEGFGLPAIEAMACGAPVVASRGHALEEIVGDAGILVDPLNEEEIAAALERVLADPSLAQELRQKSLGRAADFSWDRTAEQLITIFQEMAVKR